MPMPIDVRRIDDGDGNENTLINHHDKYHYHEACKLMFNNTKRAQKRRCPSKKRSVDQSTSSKFTRKATNVAAKEVEPELVQCFICEKFVGRSEVREAMTMQLNDRPNQCAQNLQDEKLLAKLSVGDAIAQELKYHAGYLTALYNRERSALKKKQTDDEDSPVTDIENLVLVELVTHIVETQRQSPSGAVFKLSDLCTLYQNRLQQLSSPVKLNRTRLRNRILSKFPEVQAYHRGREVVLEKVVGPAIVSACEFTDAMHLTNAADIIRKQILQSKVKFTGNFEKESVLNGVPQCLLQLVSMIEHGPDIESQLENGVTKSDLAIAQLLQYNCHKKVSKGTSHPQKHSVEREPPFAVYVALLLFAKTRKRQLIDLLFQHGMCISYDRVLEI